MVDGSSDVAAIPVGVCNFGLACVVERVCSEPEGQPMSDGYERVLRLSGYGVTVLLVAAFLSHLRRFLR